MERLLSLLEGVDLAVDLNRDLWLGHQVFENPLVSYRALAVGYSSNLDVVVVDYHVRPSDRLEASWEPPAREFYVHVFPQKRHDFLGPAVVRVLEHCLENHIFQLLREVREIPIYEVSGLPHFEDIPAMVTRMVLPPTPTIDSITADLILLAMSLLNGIGEVITRVCEEVVEDAMFQLLDDGVLSRLCDYGGLLVSRGLRARKLANSRYLCG